MTDRQIEEYVSGTSGQGASLESEDVHIGECDSCRKRVLEAARDRLGISDCQPAKDRFPGCPDEAALYRYAAGLCPPDLAGKMLHHAANCDFCGPQLKTYLEDLARELGAEEQESLNQLPALDMRKLARKHLPPRAGFLARFKRFFSFRTPAWRGSALAGAVALGAFAVFVLPGIIGGMRIDKAEQLTVAAFIENPKTDLRYAWAPSTFDIKLGEESSEIAPSRRPALHAAEHLADENQDSSNPRWLRINGRLALLNKDVNAVKFLKGAYDKGLRDPGTEVDLAAAYFLRDTKNSGKAEKKDQPAAQNVDATVDLLLQVLADPNLTSDTRAAALFNLAVAYEEMRWWDLAVAAWDQYLQLDKAGPWAEEGERHRTADRSKMQLMRPEGYKSPSFFEQHASDPATQDSIEEYQDAALRTWLLSSRSSQSAEPARALSMLADALEQEHGDPWMKDFLRRRQPGDEKAVEALGIAIANNRRGTHDKAIDHARLAEGIFRLTGNTPGALRAEFEAMYASQRSMASELCMDQAPRLEQGLRGTNYHWLQIQLALTQASCLNRSEDFAAADKMLAVGFENAQKFKFHILELRAVMLVAGMKAGRGDCDGTFRAATEGLDLYWRGPRLPFWQYQLYSTMKQCLERENLARPFEAKWRAEEALQRRMISLLESEINLEDRNGTLETTAHDSLKLILTALNEPAPEVAAHPQADSTLATTYLLPIKIELADLQLETGHNPQTALATLASAESLVTTTKDDLILLDFYRVRGDVLLKLQRFEAAEAAYAKGLEMAEQAFKGLKDHAQRQKWMMATGEIYRALVGVFVEQGHAEQALQLWEWYRSRAWVLDPDHATPANEISWPEIESKVRRVHIPVNALETRVIYAFVKDRVYIWTIGPAGVNMPRAVAIAREQLQQRIGDFAPEIRTESSNEAVLEKDSRRLFSLFLAPVVSDLKGGTTVVVELDDPLMNGLLLEPLESPAGRYFGLETPVLYSPGMLKESELRAFSGRPPSSPWMLNALTTNDQALAERLPGVKVENAMDMTPDKLKAQLAQSDVFISFGHGAEGKLLMPNRSPLGTEDFPPQYLQKLQVAALIACSSGSGETGILDTTNLVHAMLAGGVPSVMASQWDVSRDSSTQLLVNFYSHIARGETAARSLLAARQAVYSSGRSHPYYWAGFTIAGTAH